MSALNKRTDQLKTPVRCAVIGLGVGGGHCRNLLDCENAVLAAVADLDEKRLQTYRDELGADALFSDYREMLKRVKPDMVVVALPNYLHKPVAIDAMQAGAHVLCEKPMAMTIEEAQAMLDVAQSCDRRLGINFSQRFMPANRALKQLADGGALGAAYHAYCSWTRRDGIPGFGGWFGQRELSGGGPLIDLGVHRIDLCMWLMGHPRVISVSGVTHSNIGIPRARAQECKFDVEDFAAGLIRFENGASLLCEVSWAGHQRERESQRMRIMGTEGAIEMDGGYYHHSRSGDVFLKTEIDAGAIRASNACEDMVNCLITGGKPTGDPAHGVNVQRVLNGLYESTRTGREVVFD